MKAIAAERKLRGLTQEDLATALGVERATVARWETGASAPSVSTVLAMADLFECSTDYLFGRSMDRLPR